MAVLLKPWTRNFNWNNALHRGKRRSLEHEEAEVLQEIFVMPKFIDHDAYIAAAPETFQPLLVRLRTQLALALPDATELISHDMPGFGFGKSIVAGYAAFSKQCGLYVNGGAIVAHADDIAATGLKATKTGVTFSSNKPIPDELVRTLALASRRELGL